MLRIIEERNYLNGLTTILKDENSDKVKLNLAELQRVCFSVEKGEEVTVLSGLLNNFEKTTDLRKSLRKGSKLSRDTLNQIAGINDV